MTSYVRVIPAATSADRVQPWSPHRRRRRRGPAGAAAASARCRDGRPIAATQLNQLELRRGRLFGRRLSQDQRDTLDVALIDDDPRQFRHHCRCTDDVGSNTNGPLERDIATFTLLSRGVRVENSFDQPPIAQLQADPRNVPLPAPERRDPHRFPCKSCGIPAMNEPMKRVGEQHRSGHDDRSGPRRRCDPLLDVPAAV